MKKYLGGQCEGYPNQECQNEAEHSIFDFVLCGDCARNYVSEGESELRARLANLTIAAEAAYQILADTIEYEEYESPDPEISRAFNLLFEALDKAPAPEAEPDYEELPL